MLIKILRYRYGFLTVLGCTKAYDVILLRVLELVNELYCCLLQIYVRGCVLEKVNVSKMNPNTIKNPQLQQICVGGTIVVPLVQQPQSPLLLLVQVLLRKLVRSPMRSFLWNCVRTVVVLLVQLVQQLQSCLLQSPLLLLAVQVLQVVIL